MNTIRQTNLKSIEFDLLFARLAILLSDSVQSLTFILLIYQGLFWINCFNILRYLIKIRKDSSLDFHIVSRRNKHKNIIYLSLHALVCDKYSLFYT